MSHGATYVRKAVEKVPDRGVWSPSGSRSGGRSCSFRLIAHYALSETTHGLPVNELFDLGFVWEVVCSDTDTTNDQNDQASVAPL